ncbi:MAG: hypothetical protein OER77_06060, partial [Myxococcales bacterium]|nr:hypothetical protein [Myxococcales bacterium]
TKSHTLLAFSLTLALGLQACGSADTGTTEKLIPRTWEAGDIDPYGCPFIDPVPWVSAEVHQETCGPRCEPDGVNSTFVACIGDEVPRYPEDTAISQVTVCLTHPIDGKDYRFGNQSTAWPITHLCWRPCGSDLPFVPHDRFEGLEFNPPLECFEE